MTGYGRGQADNAGDSATVEISAVNSRKQVEIRFSIPRELGMLEPQLRQQIQQRLSRGSLYVAVTFQLGNAAAAQHAAIDTAAALRAIQVLREIKRSAGLLADPVFSDILAFPGVLNVGESSRYEPVKALVSEALARALEQLEETRCREGEALQRDLLQRGEVLRRALQAIQARGPEALQQQKERLRERLAALGLELNLEDERLLKELILYTERADITEELVRLQSHLQQYDALLHSHDDPGRQLDFLGQEMNREINTLAAKTADLQIAQEALLLKTEMGRIREQVMNIE